MKVQISFFAYLWKICVAVTVKFFFDLVIWVGRDPFGDLSGWARCTLSRELPELVVGSWYPAVRKFEFLGSTNFCFVEYVEE